MSDSVITAVVSSLKRGSRDGRARPHKPVLWLTILGLWDRGHISENEIHFDTKLLQEFKKIFSEYALGDDLAQASQPYFHLRSSGIWHHKVRPGEEDYYNSLTTSGGGSKRIERSIQYAYLDDDVYAGLKTPQNREELRRVLVTLLRDEARGSA